MVVGRALGRAPARRVASNAGGMLQVEAIHRIIRPCVCLGAGRPSAALATTRTSYEVVVLTAGTHDVLGTSYERKVIAAGAHDVLSAGSTRRPRSARPCPCGRYDVAGLAARRCRSVPRRRRECPDLVPGDPGDRGFETEDAVRIGAVLVTVAAFTHGAHGLASSAFPQVRGLLWSRVEAGPWLVMNRSSVRFRQAAPHPL
jgi:hypothetical protein